MAVLAADLKQPTGRLPADWFADASLNAWISEGQTKASALTDSTAQDAAVTAWAYHRAYDAKAQEMQSLPQSSELSGAASINYGADRAQMWKALAREWLDTFNEYIAGTEASAPTYLFGRAAGRRGQ